MKPLHESNFGDAVDHILVQKMQ